MILFLRAAVVKFDVKAAGHCDHQLLECLMSVSRARRASRHVVQIIDALDLEWQMPPAFEKGQIAARVLHLRQVDDLAIGQGQRSSTP